MKWGRLEVDHAKCRTNKFAISPSNSSKLLNTTLVGVYGVSSVNHLSLSKYHFAAVLLLGL